MQKNPEKHPWKSKNKFISIPCENFKRVLQENNFKFLEEFSPSSKFNYSIDIAFPEKMIGIEINGNQHYDGNGNLKKYYQDRHDHIESLGWKLYEIHYSFCFNTENILNFMNSIREKANVKYFDYASYILTKPQKKTNSCICGKIITLNAKKCILCQRLKRRKIKRPSKSDLHSMVWSMPVSQMAKMFGVSDTAISKWCEYYNIQKPDRGFWAKFYAKQILDYQI